MNKVVDLVSAQSMRAIEHLEKLRLCTVAEDELELLLSASNPGSVVDLFGRVIAVQSDGHVADLEMEGVVLKFDLEFDSFSLGLSITYFSETADGSISTIVYCYKTSESSYKVFGDINLLNYDET